MNNKKLFKPLSFTIVVLVLFYKRPDAFYHSQFWGEEGNVFFSEAYRFGFRSIFNTCAGYFHLYPRLVFCLALALKIPFEYMPFVCCYSWLLIMLLVVVYIWNRLETTVLGKFFMAISTVLIPLQAEILMNLTNVQWIMALFPLIIFSSKDSEKNKKWFLADLLLLLIIGFTGPNLVVLLPLILLVAFKRKKILSENLRQLFLFGVAILPAFVCIMSLVIYGTVNRAEGNFSMLNPGFVDYLYLQYAFLFLGKFAFDTPEILKYVAVLILLIYAFNVAARIIKGKITDAFTIIMFLSGILYLFATLVSYRNNPAILHPHTFGIRNFFMPAVSCTWYLISVLKPTKNSIAVLSLLMVLYALENIRSTGRQQFTDFHWENYAKKITTCDTMSIPINPTGWKLFIDNRNQKK